MLMLANGTEMWQMSMTGVGLKVATMIRHQVTCPSLGAYHNAGACRVASWPLSFWSCALHRQPRHGHGCSK